jgi:hypothetical protein
VFLVTVVATLTGCGSAHHPWEQVRVVSTAANPGQGPCYSAVNHDRTEKRIICSGNPGVGACYYVDAANGPVAVDSFDSACVAARKAIEKRFNFHF